VILYVDFETFWDTKDKYSLRVMKTIDYVRDARFEVHGASVRIDDSKTIWVHRDALELFFNSLNWDKVTLICHNTYFDGLILQEHYNKIPKYYHCTLSMGRALFPYAPKGHSLDALNKFLGGEGKTQGLKETNGVRLNDMPDEMYRKLVAYAINDTIITIFCYERMVRAFPADELELMSITLRWGCVPLVELDVAKAKLALKDHLKEREKTIKAGGVGTTILGSNQKFAAYIKEELGLTPPIKLNDNEEETWAFSKTDLQFQDFMTENHELSHLWKARLAVKSTITRTRLASLIHIGQSGLLPMPLKYCGAHTLRWSGSDGLNPQNWPREGAIRKCIMAPPGYKIIVFDQSQIELRLNMWFCGELDFLKLCHDADIYKATAADHFGISVSEVTKAQRFFAKQIELGLGYGMGWKRFRRECALKDIFLTEAEAYNIVQHYRESRPKVPYMQQRLHNNIMNIYTGEEVEIGPVRFVKNGVQLPNHMTLDYSNLTPTEDNNWVYGKPGTSTKGKSYKKHIYGGLLLENIMQSLGRVIMGENILDIERELDYVSLFTTTHDEAAGLVREDKADDAFKAIKDIMGRTPNWAPGLLLEGEGNYDNRYAK
jgi:DNA polymerase